MGFEPPLQLQRRARYDKNDGKDASGNTVSDDSAFSPCLGIAWDIKGTGARASRDLCPLRLKIADGNVGGGGCGGEPGEHHVELPGTRDQPGLVVLGDEHVRMPFFAEALEQLFAGSTRSAGSTTWPFSSSVPDSPPFSPSRSFPLCRRDHAGYGTQIGSNAYAKVDLIARDWNNFYNQRIDLSTCRRPISSATSGTWRSSRTTTARSSGSTGEFSSRGSGDRPPGRRHVHVVPADRKR